MFNLHQFLGKDENDPALREFCRKLDTTEKRSADEHSIYLDYPESGICFLLHQGTGVSSIFFYSEGHQEHKSFRGEMPNGLTFSQPRNQVRNRFPVLLDTGGRDTGMFGEKIPFWDLFLWKLNELHVQYADDLTTVKLITLAVPEDQVPKGKSTDDGKLVITCIPSLVSTLLNRENRKGVPLTEEEVLQIRDNAPAIALPEKVAEAVIAKRGYKDINADNVWQEWQKARVDLR